MYPLQVAFALGLDNHPPCPVDHTLEDGDRVGPVEVLHTPGYSPGHLAFYWPERRVLFAGDAVCTWPSFGAGWPALNLNLAQHRKSISWIGITTVRWTSIHFRLPPPPLS